MQLIINDGKYFINGERKPFGSLCAAALGISKSEVSQLDALAKNGSADSLRSARELLGSHGIDAADAELLPLVDELIAFRVYIRRWLKKLSPDCTVKDALDALRPAVVILDGRFTENQRRTTLPLDIQASHNFLTVLSPSGEELPAERLEFSSLRELLLFDTLKALKLGRAPRCCKCCESWFVPTRRSEIYCSGTDDSGVSCRNRGAKESFSGKQSGELERLRKAACARVYVKKNRGAISKEDEKLRLEEIRSYYIKAVENGLSAEELEKLLG